MRGEREKTNRGDVDYRGSSFHRDNFIGGGLMRPEAEVRARLGEKRQKVWDERQTHVEDTWPWEYARLTGWLEALQWFKNRMLGSGGGEGCTWLSLEVRRK